MARNIHSHSTSAAAAAPSKSRGTRAKASASLTTKAPANTSTSATVTGGSGIKSRASENLMDREAIARLAYSYWEARGRAGGSPDEDWLRAEKELGIVSLRS